MEHNWVTTVSHDYVFCNRCGAIRLDITDEYCDGSEIGENGKFTGNIKGRKEQINRKPSKRISILS